LTISSFWFTITLALWQASNRFDIKIREESPDTSRYFIAVSDSC